MRLPYTDDPPQTTDAESTAIVDRIRERRIASGASGLVELDRALLHSPPIADGWNSFLGSIRTKTNLSTSTREIIMCRVASLNKASYEWKHHKPLLLDGLSEEGIETMSSQEKGSVASKILSIVESGSPDDFSRLENVDKAWIAKATAIMRYTDAMTKNVEVPATIWDELEQCCQNVENPEREIVEITATCAAYNCVSRFLVALGVGE